MCIRDRVHTFEMKPLEGDLFDDARTPTLRRVRLRNHVLQQVLESLGYSRKGSALGRGRISYAQLGINQLGAVYEGLLSYTGFFAKTDQMCIRDRSLHAGPQARIPPSMPSVVAAPPGLQCTRNWRD